MRTRLPGTTPSGASDAWALAASSFSALVISLLAAGCLSSPSPLPTPAEDTAQDVSEPVDVPVDATPDTTLSDTTLSDTTLSDTGTSDGDTHDVDLLDVEAGEPEVDVPGADVPAPWLEYAPENGRPAVTGDRLRWVLDPTQGYAAVEAAATAGSGQNLVWTGTGTSERMTGVLFYDWFASWRTDAAASAQLLATGPGVVRLRVQWSADAQGAAGSMSGSTMWTLHADGRVHRDERVTLDDDRSGWLVAYHTIPIERVSELVWHDGSTVRTAPAASGLGGADFLNAVTGDGQTRWLCAQGVASPEADVVLFSAHAASPEAAGLRATWNGQAGGGAAHSLHLQLDWLRSTVTTSGTWSASILTFVGAGDCASAAIYADAHRTPPPITLLKGSRALTDGDLDDDGYDEGGGFFAVTPDAGGQAELRFDGPSAPSWTLYVQSSSGEPPTLTIDGVTLTDGVDAVAAKGEGGWFIHVRRTMAVGETFQLAP